MKRIGIIIIGAVLIALIAGVGTFFPLTPAPTETAERDKQTVERGNQPDVDGDIDIAPSQNNAIQKKSAEETVDFLTLKPGGTILYFAKNLGKPRVIEFAPNDVMLVSIPDSGKVVALPDKDGDGKADETVTVIDGLNEPHGLDFREKQGMQLYVAETDKITVFDYDQQNMKATNKKKILDLPSGSGHSSRTITYLPEQDKLLISVGSACNVCVEKDNRRATVLVANADGSDSKIFADGLRNSVFLRQHPVTGEIWATDMGRDHLGDNLPPDEVNILKEGNFYGWPYAYGKKVQDKNFDGSAKGQQMTERSVSSHIDIPAHSAPLGLDFFDGALLVAYHGSWNRSTPTGYKVVRFPIDAQGNVGTQEDFITGFTNNGTVLGRPVDVVIHEGAIYISDDKAGDIYRVTLDR